MRNEARGHSLARDLPSRQDVMIALQDSMPTRRTGMIRPPPFRAEHIGSLLRPPELLRAREQHAAGELDRKGLAAIENAAIARVVKLQEDVGLQVVTDGEFRRGFTSAGVSGVKIEMTEERG